MNDKKREAFIARYREKRSAPPDEPLEATRSSMLKDLLRNELTSIPTEHWSEYFPMQVAILRFLADRYPRNFEFTRAGFDFEGPYVAGKGVNWFVDALWSRDDVLELVDDIMTGVVLQLKERYPQGLHGDAVSDVQIDATLVDRLQGVLEQAAGRAIQDGVV